MDFKEVFKKFNIKPKNESIYELAFTHSSFNADNKSHHHDYERLEFLGDAIIGSCISSLAFSNRPDLNQGDLTKLKANLVNTDSLSSLTMELGLDKYIIFGNSFEKNERNLKPLYEDVFEAFFGAMYLDQGFYFVFNLVKKVFLTKIKNYSVNDNKDYKSRLQEAMQSTHRKSVDYRLINMSGPAHERVFEVGVYFEDQLLATGVGTTKKEAEKNAAENALRKASVI